MWIAKTGKKTLHLKILRELYDFLKTEKPEEELAFPYGDLGTATSL